MSDYIIIEHDGDDTISNYGVKATLNNHSYKISYEGFVVLPYHDGYHSRFRHESDEAIIDISFSNFCSPEDAYSMLLSFGVVCHDAQSYI